MSYSVIIGGEQWTEVASIAGWKEFREWTETLDGEYGELSHFVEYGWSQELPTLTAQIASALQDDKPSADVAGIARAIQKAIGKRTSDAASIVLTDGLTANEDDSGWQSEEGETTDGQS